MFKSDRLKAIKNKGNIIFKSPFLNNLSKVEQYEFLNLCNRRKYKKDAFIYYQGDPSTGIYFIEEGTVELTVNNGSTKSGTEFSHTIKAPESFGTLSIGYEFKRLATAKSLSSSILLGFFKSDFETLKKRHPHIAVKFMETLATIALRQLSMATKELDDNSPAKKTIALQLQHYYKIVEGEENSLF